VSDGLEKGEVTCLEGTAGVPILWTLHIEIYAAGNAWDTGRGMDPQGLLLKYLVNECHRD